MIAFEALIVVKNEPLSGAAVEQRVLEQMRRTDDRLRHAEHAGLDYTAVLQGQLSADEDDSSGPRRHMASNAVIYNTGQSQLRWAVP